MLIAAIGLQCARFSKLIMNAVEVTGLCKTFRAFRRRTQALSDVSLSVAPGTIFGLLGRNERPLGPCGASSEKRSKE